MAKDKSLSFLFIFFAMFMCIMEVVPARACMSSGYFINVANEMPNGNKILVHCRSKDNDIGERTIGYNESVHWQFCDNIVSPSTLFYCHFYMGNTEQTFDVFNGQMKHDCVEKEKKEYWRCTWLVKNDGFYFVDRTAGDRKDIKKYNWKPISGS